MDVQETHDRPNDARPHDGPLCGERPLASLLPLLFIQLYRRYRGWFRATPRSEAAVGSWPRGFDPQRDPVFSRNEIIVPYAAPAIFELLVDAELWPRWYPNARDVGIELSPAGEMVLQAGSQFTWITFGARLTSRVDEFEENTRIGWRATGSATIAFHRWRLEPVGDGTTRVSTEECQVGITPRLISPLMNRALHASHELWLQQLVRRLDERSTARDALVTREERPVS